MFSIANAELKMLFRNRLVATCAVLMPLAFGAFLILSVPDAGSYGGIATLQIMVMIALGTYVTATTTLAARRQNLFLKRLRSGAASDSTIIGGLVMPIVIVSVVQVGVVLAILGATADQPPVNVGLLIVAVLLTEIMFVGFALATAGITTSPEHAQITTLPLFFLTLGVAFWVMMSNPADFTWVKRALPGGGIAELVGVAWNGGDMGNLVVLLLPSLAWAAIAAFAARAMFRWEPRA